MDHLEIPKVREWEDRRDWFVAHFDIERRGGGYIIGEHASAMLIDLEATFCAGAYLSVVIISCTIIDAHLRETGSDNQYEGGMKSAFSELTSVSGLDWLRQRRNRLIHFKQQLVPTITVEDQWQKRKSHEADAQRAVKLVSNVLFEYPWT